MSWLWTDGALWIGRITLASLAVVAVIVAAAYLADRPPPRPDPLDEHQRRRLTDRHPHKDRP